MSALPSVCWNFLSNLIISFNYSGKKSLIRVIFLPWSCNSMTIRRAKVNTQLTSLPGNASMQVFTLLPYSILGFFFFCTFAIMIAKFLSSQGSYFTSFWAIWLRRKILPQRFSEVINWRAFKLPEYPICLIEGVLKAWRALILTQHNITQDKGS